MFQYKRNNQNKLVVYLMELIAKFVLSTLLNILMCKISLKKMLLEVDFYLYF